MNTEWFNERMGVALAALHEVEHAAYITPTAFAERTLRHLDAAIRNALAARFHQSADPTT